jgi:hypothetical protein
VIRRVFALLTLILGASCASPLETGGDAGTTHDTVEASPVDVAPSDTLVDSAPLDDGANDSGHEPDVLVFDEAGGAAECPEGTLCVDVFPFTHAGNTATSSQDLFDAYSCSPETDESGNEVVYRVVLEEDGFLSAAVYDADGVDVDVHILDDLDPEACLARGHHHAAADVTAGIYYVVVDTYVGEGQEFEGAYEVDIGFTIPSYGPCDMDDGIMKRVGDGGDHLEMPATGPMVLEAHLVTQEEPKPYPSTSTEELLEHYALGQERTGYVMVRQQSWAPLEGGDFYGAGISSPTLFPVIDEHWYVCMYWTKESRPERGTKMLLRLPGTDRAVVVAAGYETGPGNLANVGGTTEETHFYLGTGHKSELTLGIATEQELPFGPRTCE